MHCGPTPDLEELRRDAGDPLSSATTGHLLSSATITSNGSAGHVPPETPSAASTTGSDSFRGGSAGSHDGTNTGGVPIDVTSDPASADAVNLGWVTRRCLDTGQPLQRLCCR